MSAFRDAYDTAVIVSDDSDLCEPVRIVKAEFGKKVGIIRVRTRLIGAFTWGHPVVC